MNRKVLKTPILTENTISTPSLKINLNIIGTERSLNSDFLILEFGMIYFLQHLDNNDNLLNDPQHGFWQGRSTITQILRFHDSILSLLEDGYAVDAIYLDFAKAFDKVDHQILLKKMSSLNITGKVWAWVNEFHRNREQRVKVDQVL